MASMPRAPQTYWSGNMENNGSRPVNPQTVVLDVAPLNCVPCIDLDPPSYNDNASSSMGNNGGSSSVQMKSETPISDQPVMMVFTSGPTKEELNRVMAATRSGVALTGQAALGMMGPAIGAADIGESENEYVFRVSLPGVKRGKNDFSCVVEPNGQIVIKGVTTTGEQTVYKHSMMFEMQTQNLCPPGKFSISFQLPGPVDNREFTSVFGSDGILEGIVKKRLSRAS